MNDFLKMTYNVGVKRDGIRHSMHIVSAADGDSVADLNRALEVDIVTGLAHVHSGHLLVVGDPAVRLLAAFTSLSLDHLLLLLISLIVGDRFFRVEQLIKLTTTEQKLCLVLLVRSVSFTLRVILILLLLLLVSRVALARF